MRGNISTRLPHLSYERAHTEKAQSMKGTAAVQLSICIPTYNFGQFIGQTLDSILPNLAEGVEVIILDGGSTDNTEHVVAERQHGNPQIIYHRQEFRGGIDRDIAKVVSLARGQYCWLISADDIVISGAVTTLLIAIRSQCDIYLCEQILCDSEMHALTEYPIFNHIRKREIFNLGARAERERYFGDARTTEAFFSFLSGPIFKRDIWEKGAGIPESFYETCWALAGRFLSLVPQGLVVDYLGEKLIYKRGGVDSFREHGVVKRLRISVEGFSHVAETIFGKGSPEVRHIQRVIRNEWTLRTILSIKLQTAISPQQESLTSLNEIVAKHYLNSGIGNTCKYLLIRLVPISLLKLLHVLSQVLRRSRFFQRASSLAQP